MRLKPVTAPAAQPVTLDEAKAHLRVTAADEDALITALIAAAVGHVDGPSGTLGRALVEQEWDLLLDDFPCDELELPLPPLRSVTSITYVDEQGATQTLAPAAYEVDASGPRGVVLPAYGQTWPRTRVQRNAVTVRFKAGYGTTGASVPAAIRAAILLLVGDLYANREAQGDTLARNATVDALLFPYRVLTP